MSQKVLIETIATGHEQLMQPIALPRLLHSQRQITDPGSMIAWDREENKCDMSDLVLWDPSGRHRFAALPSRQRLIPAEKHNIGLINIAALYAYSLFLPGQQRKRRPK